MLVLIQPLSPFIAHVNSAASKARVWNLFLEQPAISDELPSEGDSPLRTSLAVELTEVRL